ncbi:toxin-antitoxin system YwqK family antitoxin [Lacinutrix chionoecetis]
MKVKHLFIILLITSCGASKDSIHKKKIQTTQFKEDFSVTKESTFPKKDKTYYWYKSNEIHQSNRDYSGDILHGNYTKYYINNQLAEKGQFDFGLKTNQWKSWFENGQVKSIKNYSNGKLNGEFVLYSNKGEVLTSGRYYNNKKSGQWIDYISKDTLNYKQGIIVNKKDSTGNNKKPFFKRLFTRKDTLDGFNNNEINDKKRDNKIKRKDNKTNAHSKKNKKPKKDSFLKRLFSKKDKKNAKS